MTAKTNSRVAGFMFLFYIVNGVADMILSRRAISGDTVAAKLASIVQHETLFRFTTFLTLLTTVDALVLGVALWALTRDEDADLAMLALCFRAGEGVLAAVAAVRSIGVLQFAQRMSAPGSDTAATNVVGGFLLQGSALGGATLFAMGSLIFCYLFLRARSIPTLFAWLGVIASILLVIALPLQIIGLLRGMATNLVWIPMAVFEVTFGLWLIVKGVELNPSHRMAS
jgi:Domain of unknown function (DUF4386)